MPSATVLVTGADRYLGGRLVARLRSDDRVRRVVEVGTDSLDNGKITKLLADANVDTVIHSSVTASAVRSGGRTAQKESNVLGTMQLLASCQRAKSVRRVVIKSSVAAYGASARDPAVFTEDTELRAAPRGAFAGDIIEVEAYARSFARRRPDVSVTILRLAPLLGPTSDTSMTRYFSLPVVPTVLGFDPRVQFLHIEDALEVLYRVTTSDHVGPAGRPDLFNVAGPGVLLLSQAVRRAGRIAAPTPEIVLRGMAALARERGVIDFSHDQLDFLRFGRVVDCTRLERVYGMTPRSTPDAFDDFVAGHELMSVLAGPGESDPPTFAEMLRSLLSKEDSSGRG